MDLPDTMEDVDMTLRHVSRQFPDQFARALLPSGSAVASAAWLDTQVTARQRRLDRALDVMANGARRLLHAEWQLGMEADVPFRLYEYHVLLSLSAAAEASAGTTPPPIESLVVLLSGREEPWPALGEYRTSPPDAPFCGVRFRIDPVYQRTVAELEARDSPLWLIFAPLAKDADPAQMKRVLDALRARSTAREFQELTAALTVMADADKRRRGLRECIVSMLSEEVVMASWVYTQGFEKGVEKGIEQGIERGIEQGIEKGIERGIEQGIEKGIEQVLELARLAFVITYETRFGPLSAPLRARINTARDPEMLKRWCSLVAHGAREEVDRALGLDEA